MKNKKTLYLLRHAKSSWDVLGIPDKDRSLKKRGIRQIAEVGDLLVDMEVIPDVVATSPAKRSLVTACGIADAMGFSSKKIELVDCLYFCGPSAIMNWLKQQNDAASSIMIVGHNPDLSSLLNTLSGRREQMSTCTVAAIEFKIKSWSEIAKGGKLVLYEYPGANEKKSA